MAGTNISPVEFGILQSSQLSAGLTKFDTHTYVTVYIFSFIMLGFNILKSKYKEILKNFPKDFCESIHKLKHKLSDDQICT